MLKKYLDPNSTIKNLINSRHHLVALFLIFLWVLPYLITNKIQWGDYSFFLQGYEAIRLSILEFNQFPWWNPWVAGGVPLYANPQFGVFSIQTLLVLVFGAATGIKLAVIFYTFAGYFSSYLLARKYFRIEKSVAAAISLLWIFCSFFVAHLPGHFTFVWYMLGPLFIYLALAFKNWHGGLLLGVAFAAMALSAVHNPLFHIGIICAVIIFARLILDKSGRKNLAYGAATAVISLIILAGHRILFALQNVKDFPREVHDPAASFMTSTLGPILPYSLGHDLKFLNYPGDPKIAPYGFGEVTATIGIFGIFAAILACLFLIKQFKDQKQPNGFFKKYRTHIIVLATAITFLAIGYGRVFDLSPYSILKQLPVFEDMRVASRWFIWFNLSLLIFIGLIIKGMPPKSFAKFSTTTILFIAVLELFFLNFGYQARILNRPVIEPTKQTSSYEFQQTSLFGLDKLPSGDNIPNNHNLQPHFYREFEATKFNLGVLQANDALVNLNTIENPRCPWEKGCNLVLSDNAKVVYWSPNKIILERTDDDSIELNMNESSYFIINGARSTDAKVAEPYRKFIINNQEKIITIIVDPSIGSLF